MTRRPVVCLTILLALATSRVASAQMPLDLSLPVVLDAPSINSVRPGTIAPGSADTTITIYGAGLAGTPDTLRVLWNGSPLSWSAIAGREGSRITAIVPESLLDTAGTATLVVEASGRASNAVGMTIGTPPTCPTPMKDECGAAIGETPAIEIVPLHTWYPFAAAPAGGLVRVVNRDVLAQFARHTVTSTALEPSRFSQILSGRILGDGRFNVSVSSPETVDQPMEGYVRVPENETPGTMIPFFCTAHNLAMVTPLGGILVQ